MTMKSKGFEHRVWSHHEHTWDSQVPSAWWLLVYLGIAIVISMDVLFIFLHICTFPTWIVIVLPRTCYWVCYGIQLHNVWDRSCSEDRSHLFCSSFSFSPCNKYLEDRNSVSQQVVPSLTTLVCRCEVQFAIFSCSALRKPWNIQNFLDVAVVFLDANICPAATMTHGFKFPARTQKEMSLDWEDLSKTLWDGSKGACVINLGGWNNDQSTPSPLGCVKEHSWDPGWALKLLLSWTLLERKRCEVSDSSRHHLRLGLLVCDPCAGWPHWTGDSGVWLNKGINLSHFAYFPFPSTPPDQCKDLVLNSLPHPSGQSELILVQPQGTWGTISTGTIPLLCNLCANAL